jgi:TatA/E family protein of Tat protein translocase
MFGLGPFEMGIVCVIALVLFGSQLPKALRGLGAGLRGFRDELKEVQK